MQVQLLNLLTVGISFDNEDEYDLAKKATSFRNPKAFILKKKCSWLKHWDGKTEYLKPDRWKGSGFTYQLPRGLFHRLKGADQHHLSSSENITFEDHLEGKTLSEEQIKACKALLGTDYGNVVMEVASGKTLIFANAISCYREAFTTGRVLVIEPRVSLLHQVRRELNNSSGKLRGLVGIAGDSQLDLNRKEVLVATPHTLCQSESAELRDWLLTVSLVIIDECHHASADNYQQSILSCQNATMLWGVSGKVEFLRQTQSDKEVAIEAVFGKPKHSGKAPERHCPIVVKRYTNKAWDGTLEKGVPSALYDGCEVAFKIDPTQNWKVGTYHGFSENGSASPLCRTMRDGKAVVDKEKFGIYYKGQQVLDADPLYTVYKTQHDVGIMEFRPRNQWAVSLAATLKGEPFVCTTKKIRHCLRVHKMMTDMGLKVGLVYGGVDSKIQEKHFAALCNREIDGIVAVYNCISEGVDLPLLTHLIKLDGIGSEQVLEQQKGRVQRAHPEKEKGYIHIPIDLQSQSLAKKSRSFVAYYKQSGIVIEDVVSQ